MGLPGRSWPPTQRQQSHPKRRPRERHPAGPPAVLEPDHREGAAQPDAHRPGEPPDLAVPADAGGGRLLHLHRGPPAGLGRGDQRPAQRQRRQHDLPGAHDLGADPDRVRRPALTATAIAGERERQTLDLLLCTRVRPATIVVGKLFSSLLFALLLLVASVPIFSMVFLFGGVELPQVAGVAVILGVTAVVVGAIGLACSSALRRPTAATVVAYILSFLYVTIPLGTSVIWPAPFTS